MRPLKRIFVRGHIGSTPDPELVADMDLARLVPAAEAGDESQMPSHSTSPPPVPPLRPAPGAEGEGNFDHGFSTHERRLDVAPRRAAGA